MLNPNTLQSCVVDLLERPTGQTVEPDHDGDLSEQSRGGSSSVRVIPNGGDPVVQVFSVAGDTITAPPDPYEAVSDSYSRLKSDRAFLVADRVFIESEMIGADINVANLHHACRTVAQATDGFGRGLAERLGGHALFADRNTPGYHANHPRELGGYL